MVNNIIQAEQQINRARQQLQEQRSQVEQRKQEAESAKQKLIAEEKKLPTYSQQKLRSGVYTGLEGRKRRQIVSGIKSDIEEKKKQVGLFKSALIEYEEKELNPFETQLKQEETKVSEYKKHLDAIRLAEKVALGEKSPLILSYNKLAKSYYRKMLSSRQPVVPEQVTTSIDSENIRIGEPTYYEQKLTLKDIGVGIGNILQGRGFATQREGAFQTYKEVDKPETTITTKTISTELLSVPKLSVLKTPSFSFSPPRDLGRTEFRKEFSSLGKIDTEMTKGVVDKLKRPFLTTGSPKRFTPLVSLKPIRPPTPSKPSKKIIKKSLFESKKEEDNNIFSNGKKEKSKKSKKKKSIWGW